MASTKTFTSRVEAAAWVAEFPGQLVGQIKEKQGPPKKIWQEIAPDMQGIPNDEPWLLKRADRQLARVVFSANSETDRAYAAKRYTETISGLMETVERAARLLSTVTDLQQKNAQLMTSLQVTYEERTASLDKSAAETTKALSVHKMIEVIFARLMAWNEARKGQLPQGEQMILEKLLVGLAEKRAHQTVSDICDSVGLSYEATKGQDHHGKEEEGNDRDSSSPGGGATNRRSRKNR